MLHPFPTPYKTGSNVLQCPGYSMIKQRALKAILVLCVACAALAPCQVKVTTEHNDTARTGQNVSETQLTTSNVNAATFGKLFSYSVDGQIVGQPLYLPNVTIAGSAHNVVYVATQHDSVYAFDADSNQGGNSSPLWSVSFISPPSVTTQPASDQGCGPETGYSEIGVMGTPVIDTSSHTLYVVAKTKENDAAVFRLHALDVASGKEKFGGPVVITASVANSSGSIVKFNPTHQAQRPGLLLANGNVYIAFGSNGCDYHAYGWVMAYTASTLQQVDVINLNPNANYGASVWQSGGGIAADSSGNLYFATANGKFDANTGGPDFGDSVLKLNSTLNWTDYFTPHDQANLNSQDLDLGSGGVLLLPDQTTSHPHLLVAGGKAGTIYLIDRDNMGRYNAKQDQIVEELSSATGTLYSVPTYWNGYVYFAPRFGSVAAFALNNGVLTTTPVAQSIQLYARGVPSLSANGSSNGILWLYRGSYTSAKLTAFDAKTLNIIYSSDQAANNRDLVGAIAHFATPTIAQGKVYVGTQSSLMVYGLLANRPGAPE